MKYTNRELICKAMDGIIAQGDKSQSEDPCMTDDNGTPVCLYRGPEGRKCGAGHLIDDEHMPADVNSSPYNDPIIVEALLASGIDNSQIGLVGKLQRIHDQHPVYTWPMHKEALLSQYS